MLPRSYSPLLPLHIRMIGLQARAVRLEPSRQNKTLQLSAHLLQSSLEHSAALPSFENYRLPPRSLTYYLNPSFPDPLAAGRWRTQ
jgi:hypothetical protein